MTDSFWNGGHDAYESGLEQEYDIALAALQVRRSRCTTKSEREAIDLEIQQLQVEFKPEIGDDGMLLF